MVQAPHRLGSTVSYRDVITLEPGKRGGRRVRITAADALGWATAGLPSRDTIDAYPDLREEASAPASRSQPIVSGAA